MARRPNDLLRCGTYNSGLLVVRFSADPNVTITITIFNDGTFKVSKQLGLEDAGDDEPEPEPEPNHDGLASDDVADDANPE